MNECAIWIASGQRYANEAIVSARSVKRHNPKLPRIIFTDVSHKGMEIFTHFYSVVRQFDLWYIDCVSFLNQAIKKLDCERILLLDTDTYICDNLSEHFEILERFDIAGTHPPGRITTGSVYDIPVSFPELHIGALTFKNNSRIWGLFDQWLYLYTQNKETYGNNDQGPLRDALWINPSVSLGIMPPEFCFRFPFGGQLRGKCKVLHGRSNQSYESIERHVNDEARRIRVFRRGLFTKRK